MTRPRIILVAAALAAAFLPASALRPGASAVLAAEGGATTSPAPAQQQPAEKPSLDSEAARKLLTVRPDDRVLGRADAKLTVFEFASLTCPHCAHFEVEMLPEVERDYVATGKLRLVYRDFPLDRLALVGSVIARCITDPARSMAYVRHLFETQSAWVSADDPVGALEQRAEPFGLSAADSKACLADQERVRAVVADEKDAIDHVGVDSTPTFVAGGKMHAGIGSYAEFRAFVDPLLK